MVTARLCSAAVSLLAAAGCVSFGPVAGTSTGSAPGSTGGAVRISYQIDAGDMGVPLAFSSIRAREVSYREVTTSRLSGRSVGLLTVEYPHPAARPGMAMVGVAIRHGQSDSPLAQAAGMWRELWRSDDEAEPSRGEMYETWVLDIPREEVDSLVERIRADGFFDQPGVNRNHIQLTIRIAGQETRKSWRQVGELDALMHRARTQGQLVAFRGSAHPPQPGDGTPASIVALRAYEQQREDLLRRQ